MRTSSYRLSLKLGAFSHQSGYIWLSLIILFVLSCVIAELLGAIFACVDGLLVVLVPLCGPILPVIHLLGLVDIAAVLKLNVNVAL